MADDAITFRLGVDKSQLTAGLSEAQAEAAASGQKIAGGLGRAAEGGEKIFTSSHRAANQIRTLSRELSSGAEAGDLFAAGLEAAERVLRLPLGSLAGLAVAGIVIKQLHDVADADEKLKRQLATSLNPSAITDYSAAVETLSERYKVTAEAVAQSQQRISNPTFFQSLKDTLSNIFSSSSIGTPTGGRGQFAGELPGAGGGRGKQPSELDTEATAAAIAAAQTEQRYRLELQINEARKSGVDSEKKIYDLTLAAAQVELEALKKAFPKEEDQAKAKFNAQSKVDAIKSEKQQTEEAKKQQEAEEKQTSAYRERFGMSLRELAEGRGGSPETQYQRRQARRALGEEAESERLRLRGDETGAAVHAGRASDIEAGIQGLKPSSMSNDVKTGVDASQLNQKMDRLIASSERNGIS